MLGSMSVDVSPRFDVSFSAIFRKIRRMILPLQVFGSARENDVVGLGERSHVATYLI